MTEAVIALLSIGMLVLAARTLALRRALGLSDRRLATVSAERDSAWAEAAKMRSEIDRLTEDGETQRLAYEGLRRSLAEAQASRDETRSEIQTLDDAAEAAIKANSNLRMALARLMRVGSTQEGG